MKPYDLEVSKMDILFVLEILRVITLEALCLVLCFGTLLTVKSKEVFTTRYEIF